MPLKAPAEVAYPSWTGFYLGGVVGVGSHQTEYNDGDDNVSCCQTMYGKAFGINAGVTAGYNWQVQSFVLGFEGDWSWTNADTGQIIGYDPGAYYETRTNWFATARARAGVDVNNVLIYITGGPAWVNANHTANYNNEAFYLGSGTNTTLGLAVGAGIEAKFTPQWSVKLEYLFLDMPTVQITPPSSCSYGFNDSAQIIRGGVNYHF